MRILSNTKALSTIIVILLLILSAILGGIISYMFTIPQFTDLPEGTTLTITDVYFDKNNAAWFKVGVLNPSYSPSNATITRITVSLKGQSTLYDVIEAEPSIQEGISVQKGQLMNIICSKIRIDGENVTWGRFAGEHGGETVVVSIFSSDASAANKEKQLPFVKLSVTPYFYPRISYKNFSLSLAMATNSEINVTVNWIDIPGIDDIALKSPTLPYEVTKTSVSFNFTGNWHGLKKANVMIETNEGYQFIKELDLQQVYPLIQNVTFNVDTMDHFNVTIFNFAETNNYVNVTMITCTPENATAITNNYSVGLEANQSSVFKFDWNWTETRGKKIEVKAYTLQEIEINFTAITPPPIIVKILNENETFNLQDRTHFNVTLQNHASSLDAINITKIVVAETGELVNGTKADPQLPYGLINSSAVQPFYCNISDWTNRAGENLTLTVYVLANKTGEEYVFNFTFALPVAELNITEVATAEFGDFHTKYLNITVESLSYSIWNLTVSKVTIKLQNQTVLAEGIIPENQTIIKPSEIAILLCQFDWKAYPDTDVVIIVATKEGVEATTTFHIP
ncbi:MAG: hypothetical protein QXN36_05940 [Candidatus Bathyarchaeia archaeon]